jgi:hypothetical protein
MKLRGWGGAEEVKTYIKSPLRRCEMGSGCYGVL